MKPRERRPGLPHPDVVAAREALAKLPPLTLDQVRAQAKASEEWRRRHSADHNPPPPRR